MLSNCRAAARPRAQQTHFVPATKWIPVIRKPYNVITLQYYSTWRRGHATWHHKLYICIHTCGLLSIWIFLVVFIHTAKMRSVLLVLHLFLPHLSFECLVYLTWSTSLSPHMIVKRIWENSRHSLAHIPVLIFVLRERVCSGCVRSPQLSVSRGSFELVWEIYTSPNTGHFFGCSWEVWLLGWPACQIFNHALWWISPSSCCILGTTVESRQLKKKKKIELPAWQTFGHVVHWCMCVCVEPGIWPL